MMLFIQNRENNAGGKKSIAEIKLFSLHERVKECGSLEVILEKELQTLIEQNMEAVITHYENQ